MSTDLTIIKLWRTILYSYLKEQPIRRTLSRKYKKMYFILTGQFWSANTKILPNVTQKF